MVVIAAATLLCACADPQRLPEWNGVWVTEGRAVNIDGFTTVGATDGAAPPALAVFSTTTPWNDVTRAKIDALMKATNGDPARGFEHGAAGWGYPLMMAGAAPLQFAITKNAVLVFNAYRDLRVIYTDGRSHMPAEEGWPPTTWGDAIGHWEGDTLVIDTIGVRDPSQYVGIAAPFSEKAHYTERLRQVSPDRIEGEMTIEDPQTLTRPVHLKLAYVRSRELNRIVLDTFTNNRSGFDGEFSTIEPPRQ